MAVSLLDLPYDVAGLVSATLPARDVVALEATCTRFAVPWTPAQKLEATLRRLSTAMEQGGSLAEAYQRVMGVRAALGPMTKSFPHADGTLCNMALFYGPETLRVTAKFEIPEVLSGRVVQAVAAYPKKQYQFTSGNVTVTFQTGNMVNLVGIDPGHWVVDGVVRVAQKPRDPTARGAIFDAVVRVMCATAAFVPGFDWHMVKRTRITARGASATRANARYDEVRATLEGAGLPETAAGRQPVTARQRDAFLDRWAPMMEGLFRERQARTGEDYCMCDDCLLPYLEAYLERFEIGDMLV